MNMPFEVKSQRTALLVVDMQNDFARSGAPMEVEGILETVKPINTLIDCARANKMPVIFTKFLAGPKPSILWRWSPAIAAQSSCFKGFMRKFADRDVELDCTDIIDEIYPKDGDYIIEKFWYSAFHNTNLKDILDMNGVDTVIVCGTVTQICVEDTVHFGFHLGYNMLIVQDGVSSFSERQQTAALENFHMKYGVVLTSEEIVSLF